MKSLKVIVVLSREKLFKDVWSSKDHLFIKYVFHSNMTCELLTSVNQNFQSWLDPIITKKTITIFKPITNENIFYFTW